MKPELITATAYYKVLGERGEAIHGGSGTWFLPNRGRPGKWMPEIADPRPCVRGYHLARGTGDLLAHIGPRIWVAEARGVEVPDGDKVAVAQARLLTATAWDVVAMRNFAADCAERVLALFEDRFPNDDRPRKAIEAARQGDAEAAGAAGAARAAWAAAKAARAAWAAAKAAWAAEAAEAARAAWAAARAAEAAEAAAEAARAAGAAARAAGAAAGAAAEAAWAAGAAWAAWAAERQWQADRLLHYLTTPAT